MNNAQVCYTAPKTVEWGTPQDFFDTLNAEFGFTLDVASNDDNAKVNRHFSLADDGLSQDWSGEVCWMNPPYGREIGAWMQKAYESSLAGATVVCLVPARTDTRWMNPPYGREIGAWMQKAYESSLAGATVVCLVPARTDTRWWWDYAIHGEVRFVKGRLKFTSEGKTLNAAPFPVAVVVFGRPAGVLWSDLNGATA